jgi:hypothetical protein
MNQQYPMRDYVDENNRLQALGEESEVDDPLIN